MTSCPLTVMTLTYSAMIMNYRRDDIVNEYSNQKWTPLLTAVYLNLPLSVEVLLEHGAGEY